MQLKSHEYLKAWVAEHLGPPERAASLCYFVNANFCYTEYFQAAKKNRADTVSFSTFEKFILSTHHGVKVSEVMGKQVFYPISFYRDFKGGYLMTG